MYPTEVKLTVFVLFRSCYTKTDFQFIFNFDWVVHSSVEKSLVLQIASRYHPIKVKPKPLAPRLHTFSWVSHQLHVFTSCFDWFTGLPGLDCLHKSYLKSSLMVHVVSRPHWLNWFSCLNEITCNQSQPTGCHWSLPIYLHGEQNVLPLSSTDASTATDMNCEIKSSCFSSVCKQTNPMTVLPGSNVTLNCSIVTEGFAQGMNWNQMLERVKNTTGLSNLILERSASTTYSGKHSCQCTTIHFTRRCFLNVHPQYQK